MTCSNNCNNNCDPCNDPCNSCGPAKYNCDFSISANPFDQSIWNVTICGNTTRMKVPKINETDTSVYTDCSKSVLVHNAEKHQDLITGEQLGCLVKLDDLKDVEVPNPDNCSLLVFNPYCTDCGDGCAPKNPQWTNYHIPDAGDCEIELDDEGYAKVLIKDDCGCIRECRLPVMPNGFTTINYIRDSVPDDPDYPWYYGQYNDKINLFLKENAPQYFGKYPLKITVNYGIQVVHSDASPNTNFRSLIVPVIEGRSVPITTHASILQDQSTVNSSPQIPWGTVSLRSSFVFIVPKGKDAYLHHEFRLRTLSSYPNYATNALDGKKVPPEEANKIDKMKYTGSRLNALQIIVEPTRGSENISPKVDTERGQLDAAVDEYPNIGV